MQQAKDNPNDSRHPPEAQTTVAIAQRDEGSQKPPCHRPLKHKQILCGDEICSRFDQISGQQPPKRMTTGKFADLAPRDKNLETPL